jgi:peptide-methionine (R)-S-oxide reductase
MNRRRFLSTSLVGLAGATALGRPFAQAPTVEQVDKIVKITKTPEEWRKVLTSVQFNVLREEGTERPFTSPLNNEKRKGTFVCAGCDLPLFDSKTKYDSGTGWPSFWKPLPDAVGRRVDYTLSIPREEVHCHRCGGHLGHVFDDGPRPTGLRYCMNGTALKFDPSGEKK